jgi:hypothetical protein
MDWSDWDQHPERHAGFGEAAMKTYGIDPTKLIDCDVCHR